VVIYLIFPTRLNQQLITYFTASATWSKEHAIMRKM